MIFHGFSWKLFAVRLHWDSSCSMESFDSSRNSNVAENCYTGDKCWRQSILRLLPHFHVVSFVPCFYRTPLAPPFRSLRNLSIPQSLYRNSSKSAFVKMRKFAHERKCIDAIFSRHGFACHSHTNTTMNRNIRREDCIAHYIDVRQIKIVHCTIFKLQIVHFSRN